MAAYTVSSFCRYCSASSFAAAAFVTNDSPRLPYRRNNRRSLYRVATSRQLHRLNRPLLESEQCSDHVPPSQRLLRLYLVLMNRFTRTVVTVSTCLGCNPATMEQIPAKNTCKLDLEPSRITSCSVGCKELAVTIIMRNRPVLLTLHTPLRLLMHRIRIRIKRNNKFWTRLRNDFHAIQQNQTLSSRVYTLHSTVPCLHVLRT